MNKKELNQQPTLAVINFTGMSVCTVLIFTIYLGENIMLPLRLCMAFAMVSVATLFALRRKSLGLLIGATISACALIAANPIGGLAYGAYIAAIFLFFHFNPCAAEVIEDWWKGIFAPEKE